MGYVRADADFPYLRFGIQQRWRWGQHSLSYEMVIFDAHPNENQKYHANTASRSISAGQR